MSGPFYHNPRPQLAIESTYTKNLGRCYNAYGFKVVSRGRLTQKQLQALREAGFLGYGQGFEIKSQCDGTELPAGQDEVLCVNEDGSPGLNKYNGNKPYPAIRQNYWVYEVEDQVDSSD